MMQTSHEKHPVLDLLQQWLEAKEGEHFEFKEAKEHYSFEKLAQYSCALSNEGGGKIILGVTDRRPRMVVGTRAFMQPEDTRRSLSEKLHLLIDFMEVKHPLGRVLVFIVPSRPIGNVIKYEGIYWSRETDSLVPMSETRLHSIFSESGHDFSADICPGATIESLDTLALEEFRKRWLDKSKNSALSAVSQEQLLRDTELLSNDGITYAALILFGTRASLGKFLSQAEVIFEYRSSEASGPAQQRKEFRQGFFSYYEELWSVINLRNDVQHYQDGLFMKDIPTFAERSVREAILNAVSHRNYQLGGSVFVRQYPQNLVIESPGGLPYGITLDNILDRQNPRNRRLADAFAKCGLVERSGQGVNLMFEQCIQQGKLLPDLKRTDEYAVVLDLNGQVRDPKFVQYLERIGQETQVSFSTHDFIVLDFIHRDEPIPSQLQYRIKTLLEYGAIERASRNRYILAKRFYSMVGKKGVYTRRKGLDRETNKHLLLKHINENAKDGTRMEELHQILPSHSRSQIQVLLRELRNSGAIHCIGIKKGARWYPGKKN
jgi:ATP-dependent DNA helicase RecG